MIFCQYNYQEFNNENMDNHHIQPYHWNNWVKMVNDNRMYCERVNIFKRIKFRWYLFTKKVEIHKLPSFHWYWSDKTRKERLLGLKSILKFNKHLTDEDRSKIKQLWKANDFPAIIRLSQETEQRAMRKLMN